jgi:hypothetical protein
LQRSDRISGIFGAAYRNGRLLADVVELSTPAELGRITVPVVGTADETHKMGRITREGTLRVHKCDTGWELELYMLFSQSLEERRRRRDACDPYNPEFSIVYKLDDPEALGVERWQLDGCRLWRLPLGFNSGDEITEREYPVTWVTEKPITAFRKGTNAAGQPCPVYIYGGP